MNGKTAVRNIRMCEKDCLCLYVCPTGASDTENSVIDSEKCIGCLKCIREIGCPALSVKDGKAVIDENLCTGCGLCEKLCPVGAIGRSTDE